ncbi:hypothetical protein [Geotalea sp. SG265]|uniref:hypothetical protein n=1 Tax=Geotalea sp. SG265 TaxID=2922867 RepID=UPI001FAEF318|nr:hypothetical protein [Geotalea sp. SG265]
MQPLIRSSFSAALLLLLLSPVPALALSAITCHCFTDRSYDAARPAAADPYFLATTQNSFFAAAFAVDKKTIVMKKQRGSSAEDLWIAYWLAARSGTDPELLLQDHNSRGSWKLVAAPLAIPVRSMGERVAQALRTDAGDGTIAGAIVDELLLRFRFLGEPELAALRKAGTGNQELILAGLLAARTRQPAMQLYSEVKKEGRSWGALLQRARLDTSNLDSEVRVLIAAAGRGIR